MTPNTRRLRMTSEARRIPGLHRIGMGDDPRIIGITIRVMAAIALGPNGVCGCCIVTQSAAIGLVFEEGDGVIRSAPPCGMGHFEPVTGGAELRL
jgi:hypothetical protein